MSDLRNNAQEIVKNIYDKASNSGMTTDELKAEIDIAVELLEDSHYCFLTRGEEEYLTTEQIESLSLSISIMTNEMLCIYRYSSL